MADRIVVMNHGVIEQVGTPSEIYARPKTAFVADFVGKMSFLHAEVTGPERLSIAGLELNCRQDKTLVAGTPVTVGLRPEEVQVRGVSPDDENAIRIIVDDFEFLGAFCRAQLRGRDAPIEFVADFSANLMRDMSIVRGQEMMVALPSASLHVFPADGQPQLEAAA